MRSMMLKVSPTSGEVFAGHPNAEPGLAPSGARNVRITEIPDNVQPADVVRIYGRTVDVTYLFHRPGDDPRGWGRHEFRFDEIGEGRIVRD